MSVWHHIDYRAQSTNEIESLQGSVEKLSDDRDNLWDQLEEMDEILLEVNEINDEKKLEIESLEEVIGDLEGELDDTKNELDDTKSKLKNVQSQRKSNRSVVHAAEIDKSEKETIEQTEVGKVGTTPSQPESSNTETVSEDKESSSVSESNSSYLGSFQATAYAVGDGLTPSTTTANGTEVANTIYTPEGYRIIAADTSVIPMNSVVRIELPNGESFNAKVSDTGSAINGNIVDLLMSSPDEALKFGRQNGIKIYLIN